MYFKCIKMSNKKLMLNMLVYRIIKYAFFMNF